MKSFEYKGKVFTGYRNLDCGKGAYANEKDFNFISSKIKNMNYLNETDGYNYEEFYKVAKKAKCYYDLYKVDNLTIIPCKRSLAVINL